MKSLLHELRACRLKKTYTTLSEANRQARKDSQKYNKQMSAYECDICFNYHLTSKGTNNGNERNKSRSNSATL